MSKSEIDQLPGGALDPEFNPEIDPLIGEVDDPDEIRDREIREDIGIEDADVPGVVEKD